MPLTNGLQTVPRTCPDLDRNRCPVGFRHVFGTEACAGGVPPSQLWRLGNVRTVSSSASVVGPLARLLADLLLTRYVHAAGYVAGPGISQLPVGPGRSLPDLVVVRHSSGWNWTFMRQVLR